MNDRLKDKIYSKIDEIDAKHVGESWDEDDLLALAEHCYNLALEDVKKEVEIRIEEKEWALKKLECNEHERSQTFAQKISLSSLLYFIDNLTK